MAIENQTPQDIAADTAVGTTAEIAYVDREHGEFVVPSGSSITSITWHAAEKPGGTYGAAQDESGTAVTQTVAAGESHPIPDALRGAGAIKPVTNAAGTLHVLTKG